MSVTALLRGTDIPICSPNSATDPLSQGNSRRFHCPEHQTTGPSPECANAPTFSTPTSYLDQYVDHDTKARQGWEIHSANGRPEKPNAGLDGAVKIHVESPFHRNEQQSQNRQADLP
jgi:hypothetical protein